MPKKRRPLAPEPLAPEPPAVSPVGAAPVGAAPLPFYRRALLAILGISFVLRLLLVLAGGQDYFPDETRYWTSREAAQAFWSGDFEGGLRILHSAPDHFLFKVCGTLPASLELLVGERPAIPATFFALFSVASLWLVWAILRRVGENERTAFFGASLLALTATFFYYSRHLLPYDMAMAAGLAALYTGLRASGRAAESLVCGLLAAATFLTYNGYWVLAGFAMAAHTLWGTRSLHGMARRALLAGGGFVGSITALLEGNSLLGGDLAKKFVAFSGTITQGSFAEGGTLLFPYFWYAEHGIAVLWAAALLFAVVSLARGRRQEALLLGLGGLLFVYSALFFFSVVLEKFVVYGRLARQLAPFCCLLSALLLERMWTSSRRGRLAAIALLALAAMQAAFNFRPVFQQVFPAEFRQLAAAAIGSSDPGAYGRLNDLYIWPEPQTEPPGVEILLRRPHPVEYLPMQYEGYSPEQRRILRSADVSMIVYRQTAALVFADGFESGSTGAWSVSTPGAGATR